MKAGVTGATGFVGGKLVEKLVQDGFEVKCLVRKSSNVEKLNELGVELVYGDLKDKESLVSFPAGCDYVFHIAAHVSDWGRREEFYEKNVEATKTLLKSSAENGVKRFIHMSSSTVIWRSDFQNIHKLENVDEEYPYPAKYNDHYNETKKLAEEVVISKNGENGLETVVIRPSNVWGAGDTVVLARIADAAVRGVLINMGRNRKIVSPCNINNLVHGTMLSAISENAPGNIFFINDGRELDNKVFVKDQLNSAGIDWEPKITVPYKIGYMIAYALELLFKLLNSDKPPVLTRFAVSALAGSRTYSISKAENLLGYKSVITYEKGMQELKEWVERIGGFRQLIKHAK